MEAPAAAQRRLLDLQAIDLGLDQLAHRRRTLPEHAEITRLTSEIGELGTAVAAAESVVADLDRKIGVLENDIEQVRARSARDQQRLDSGAPAAKELERLQHEVGTLAARQSELEDAELELMEEREGAEGVRDEVAGRRDAANAALAAAEGRRDDTEKSIDAEIAERTAERAPLAGTIPADLLTLYERIRKANAGIGAAQLRARRCGGCRIELSGVDLSAAREATEDEVLRCEECGRILIRTEESGL